MYKRLAIQGFPALGLSPKPPGNNASLRHHAALDRPPLPELFAPKALAMKHLEYS